MVVPLARPRGGAARRGAALVPRAAEATQKAKPDWAGDDVLSKVVDAAINNKVLYEGLMKPMDAAHADQHRGEERRGLGATSPRGSRRIPASRSTSTPVKNDAVEYPEYYLKPFRAYAEGNLGSRRSRLSPRRTPWPCASIPRTGTAEVAQARLRDSYTEALRACVDAHAAGEPKTILDVGPVGISTQYISVTARSPRRG